MPTLTVDQLNDRFAVGDAARFEAGEGGLKRLAIATPHATAQVYLHGAHVAQWQPDGFAPVLWLSQRSHFAAGKPIRGGVPICFPWFGPNADDPAAPAHGLARTKAWDVAGVHRTADGEVVVELETLVLDFAVTYTVTVGPSLTMTLHARNRAAAPRRFEAALHTYFTVGDVRQVRIAGLAGATYIDKVDAARRKVQGAEPIMFTQETDRVYLDTTAACVLDDPVLLRRITVEKAGSQTTVVWNPWTAKAARMEDFGDDEWPGMCCIETANVADHAVTLSPGGDHGMTAAIHVERH
jgi:glucose-6-phosphate 1-epimerase